MPLFKWYKNEENNYLTLFLMSSCFLTKKEDTKKEVNENIKIDASEIDEELEDETISLKEDDDKSKDSSNNNGNENQNSISTNSNTNLENSNSNNSSTSQNSSSVNNDDNAQTGDNENNNNEHVHTIVIDEAIPPTCLEEGKTEGKHCSVCGEIIVAQETINSYGGHNFIDGKCSRCGEVLDENANDVKLPPMPLK